MPYIHLIAGLCMIFTRSLSPLVRDLLEVPTPVWITTVDHRLNSDQQGSTTARTAPGRTYDCLTIACQYGSQCVCILILLADSGWGG